MSTSEERLAAIFNRIAQRMAADFEANREQINHRGIRGSAAEDVLVTEFLEKYLPSTVSIRRNAEIISTAGEVSTECDIVVCDPSTPPLWDSHGAAVLPAECVYGVIEVKSDLDTRDLRAAWANAAAIKRFPKTAFLEGVEPFVQTLSLYGKSWNYSPTMAYLFAFTSSTSLETLGQVMVELAQETEPEHRLDGLWILDRGAFAWARSETRAWTSTANDGIEGLLIGNQDGGSPVPLMAIQLQGIFNSVYARPFDLGPYSGNLPLGGELTLVTPSGARGLEGEQPLGRKTPPPLRHQTWPTQ